MSPHDESNLRPDSAYLMQLQQSAEALRRECVVDAIILDGMGRAFVQRRAPNRRLLPNCWDLVGGHVERGETLFEALTREIEEESGWRLVRLLHLIAVTDWEAEQDGQLRPKREFTFLVEVQGDLGAPAVEREKVSEFRWIAPDDLDVLRENRTPADMFIFDVVHAGFVAAQAEPDDGSPSHQT